MFCRKQSHSEHTATHHIIPSNRLWMMRCDWVTTISNVTWVHPNWKRRQQALDTAVHITGSDALAIRCYTSENSSCRRAVLACTFTTTNTQGHQSWQQSPAVLYRHALYLKPRGDFHWEDFCWTKGSLAHPHPTHLSLLTIEEETDRYPSHIPVC